MTKEIGEADGTGIKKIFFISSKQMPRLFNKTKMVLKVCQIKLTNDSFRLIPARTPAVPSSVWYIVPRDNAVKSCNK